MTIIEQIMQVLTVNNMMFLMRGLYLTVLISAISILLSLFFGTILAVVRNMHSGILRHFASIYIEVVRNVPNMLWIFVIFLILRIQSVPAGIASFTIFTAAAFAEIIRGGLNSVEEGQIEAATSQGLNKFQVFYYIVFPQAIRSILPAIISQCATVVKDTSMLAYVIALQELFGSANLLLVRYVYASQVLTLYGIVALIYFIINFTISEISRYFSRKWAQSM